MTTDSFIEKLKQQRRIIAQLSSAGLVSNSLLGAVLGPEPLKQVIAGTCCVELIVLLLIFSFREQAVLCAKRLLLVLVLSACSSMLALIAYGVLRHEYTVKRFEDRPRITVGYELKDDIRQMVEKHVYQDPMDVLEAYQYDPFKVWKSSSIYLIESSLVVSWSVFVVGLSSAIFVFVLRTETKGVNVPKRKSGTKARRIKDEGTEKA